DRSYGVQVARLAGLPAPVIARAKALLAELEEAGQLRTDASDAVQLGLFAQPGPDPLLAELASLDLAHLTPLEPWNILATWQQRPGGHGPAPDGCRPTWSTRSPPARSSSARPRLSRSWSKTRSTPAPPLSLSTCATAEAR